MRILTISCLAIFFALCTVCFAIEVEFHLYPGWNLSAMPCTTSYDTIANVLTILPPAFTYDPTSGSYCIAYKFPAPNVGFWVLSLTETTFTIECECVDVPLDICDPMRPVVLNGDTIPEERIYRYTTGCVSEMYLHEMGISDPNCLSGIEQYPTLHWLSLQYNQLTSIDLLPLSSCPDLLILSLYGNQLTSIDLTPLSSCTNFMWLELTFNQLTSIDLSPIWGLDLLGLYLDNNYLDSTSCAHVCDYIDEHPSCDVLTDCDCD